MFGYVRLLLCLVILGYGYVPLNITLNKNRILNLGEFYIIMQPFITDIKKFVTSILPEKIELIDITFNPENKSRVLRVTLDSEDLSLDTIALISRDISKWLDENEAKIPYSKYTLEVSSAGLDKPLKKRKDFERIIGNLCKIETKNKASDGRKRYRGEIKSVTDQSVELYIEEESTSFNIEYENILNAQIDFKS